MAQYQYTPYFENEVLRKSPIFKKNGALRSWRIPSEWSGKKAIGGDSGAGFRSLEEEP
jgi:hypothetical protein